MSGVETRIRETIGVLLVLCLSVGCSKSPTQPSTSTTPGQNPSATPVAALQVKVDDGMPRDAIASLSEVVVDASGSTGTGVLTFAIDFGDGTVVTSGTARHTYATAGTFTIAATVTDAQGRKATASSALTVKAVTGRWFQAQYVKRSNRVEVRQLTIEAQDGLSIRGIYRTTGDADRSVTGRLTPPRKIEIALSGGAGLLGLLPDRLDGASTPWTLVAQGDSVDGERLDFSGVAGDPVGEPPKADLKLVFDGVGNVPIVSLTPVSFDASASRGSGLTYFIEFGDGTSSVGAHATRIYETGIPRLTVVDRFGRSDSVVPRWDGSFTVGWGEGGLQEYWKSSDPFLGLNFPGRNGVNYSGGAWGLYPGTATATLSGVRDVRVTIREPAITLQGTIDKDGLGLTLVQSGGGQDGKVWKMKLHFAF